ncbi:MAG: peptidylprolyl isomerase, partial [Ignavibacteria bacterium]|nr:peptidylprolyl isomerase [Ignavibacteria bacterium]
MQKSIIFLILLLSPVTTLPQIISEEVIAKVGNNVITEQEFLARYELTPQVTAGIKGMEESLKKEVLYSIISEELWALEANELGLGTSDLLKYTYKVYEELYVRDALYKEEILSKVYLSDEYLTEAFRRNSQILQVNYLFSSTQHEIDSLYNQLNNSAYFDSILTHRPESSLQTEPYYVSYGQMDKEVEDMLYCLNIGQYTKPVKAPNGWYIFKLVKIGQNILMNPEQADAEQKKVLKIAHTTVTDSIYKGFYEQFFSGVNAETNGVLFQKFSKRVIKSLFDRKQNENIPDGKEIFLKPDDLYGIENDLGAESLNELLIELDDQPVKLKEFIQYFAFESFGVDTIDNNMIMNKLNLRVKRYIEHKLLSREGYRRGLQLSADVQLQLNMWRSYYLSNALRDRMLDNILVDDDELLIHFQSMKKEFATISDSVEVMEKLKFELKQKKFNKLLTDKTIELANKYSVQVNDELLENLEVTNTTTVIYRYLGFGGRILAVPMTIPNYNWV